MHLYCGSQLMNKSCQLTQFSSSDYFFFFLRVWNRNTVMEKLTLVQKSQRRSGKETGSLPDG